MQESVLLNFRQNNPGSIAMKCGDYIYYFGRNRSSHDARMDNRLVKTYEKGQCLLPHDEYKLFKQSSSTKTRQCSTFSTK